MFPVAQEGWVFFPAQKITVRLVVKMIILSSTCFMITSAYEEDKKDD